ncbi:MAG TPA: hypothetical protein VGE24_14900, partial [Emticicia sp.]
MYLRLPAHSPINRHKSKLLIFLLTIAIVAVGLIVLLINYLNGNKLFHSFDTKPAAYQLENAFP